MKWEIMITVNNPEALRDLLHRAIDAAAREDIAFVSVNRIEEAD